MRLVKYIIIVFIPYLIFSCSSIEQNEPDEVLLKVRPDTTIVQAPNNVKVSIDSIETVYNYATNKIRLTNFVIGDSLIGCELFVESGYFQYKYFHTFSFDTLIINVIDSSKLDKSKLNYSDLKRAKVTGNKVHFIKNSVYMSLDFVIDEQDYTTMYVINPKGKVGENFYYSGGVD